MHRNYSNHVVIIANLVEGLHYVLHKAGLAFGHIGIVLVTVLRDVETSMASID